MLERHNLFSFQSLPWYTEIKIIFLIHFVKLIYAATNSSQILNKERKNKNDIAAYKKFHFMGKDKKIKNSKSNITET